MKCFACESDFFRDTFVYDSKNGKYTGTHSIGVCGRVYDLCPRCCKLFLLAAAFADGRIVPVPEGENHA